jgi:hypothetical protein
MSALTSVVVALNALANALGEALHPIELLPGWLSATVIAVFTGAGLLLVFKYTSNQRAIKQVRRGIRADLLAVKLFKDDLRVGLRAQGRVIGGAVRLLVLALVPVLVMAVPGVLLLAQIGAWYQAAPLPVGDETVVTVVLGGSPGEPLPAVELIPNGAVEDLSGPVRGFGPREVCWAVQARQPGYHRLEVRASGRTVEKEVVIGTGVMRVSPTRPERRLSADLIEYPREEPLGADSPVRSITVQYPVRSSWTTGADNWVIYWFVVSFGAGFCLRGVLGVNL